MNSKPVKRWLQLPALRDEALSVELRQFDPYDIMGYVAFAAALTNMIASISGAYVAYDMLLSVSLVLGLLSFFNWRSLLGKTAPVLVVVHVVGLHVIRIL